MTCLREVKSTSGQERLKNVSEAQIYSPYIPNLTGHYAHKLRVLNDQGVCLGGCRSGEESQTVLLLTILVRLHLF